MTDKRTILITGCSDGSLGAALAKAFHSRGWRVFASARNLAKLKQAEAAGIEVLQLDTLSDESIARCVTKVKSFTGGSLDLLLNNAGAGYSMPVLDIDIAKVQELFKLNVFSLISTSRAFFPLLAKSSHGGIIVNNTSCSSIATGALPFAGAYAASKAAANNLTEVMRMELAPFGIKVINLMTGSVKSTFFNNTPQAVLPANSLFQISKEAVEKEMSGVEAQTGSTDPDKWADQVAKDLSKPDPSHWLFKGKFSTIVRLASHLPIGTMDSAVKSRTGLDIVERKIKEKGGLKNIKIE